MEGAERPVIGDNAESSVEIVKESKDTGDCFVAFLDILGFKDRVARTSHADLRALLWKFNTQISKIAGQYSRGKLELVQFSDSIVLFTQDTKSASLEALALTVRGIMSEAIGDMIPIKGAIAKGRMTVNKSKQLFFGQALIDAYLLQESVYYYGIVVHHTAESSAKSLGRLFRDFKVCLKSGAISHFELVWWDEADKGTTIQKLSEIRATVSDAPRKYLDNTISTINPKEG